MTMKQFGPCPQKICNLEKDHYSKPTSLLSSHLGNVFFFQYIHTVSLPALLFLFHFSLTLNTALKTLTHTEQLVVNSIMERMVSFSYRVLFLYIQER